MATLFRMMMANDKFFGKELEVLLVVLDLFYRRWSLRLEMAKIKLFIEPKGRTCLCGPETQQQKRRTKPIRK